jgi:polo-like kinase 1
VLYAPVDKSNIVFAQESSHP